MLFCAELPTAALYVANESFSASAQIRMRCSGEASSRSIFPAITLERRTAGWHLCRPVYAIMNLTVTAPQSAPPHPSKEERERSRKRTARKNTLIAYSFIAPNFIGFMALTMLPILFSIVLAFMKWDSAHPMEFVGLQNFMKLPTDSTFLISLKNTVLFAVITVPLTIFCSMALALLLNAPIRCRVFFRSVYFFPYVASLVAVAVVWNMLFHPDMGPVNSLLHALGMQNPPRWSADIHWALPTVMSMNIWKNMGYYMIVYLAALQGIPRELYEAAIMDGASAWQRLRFITLPMLTSTTFFVLIMNVINAFKVFDQVYMMTQGGPGRSSMVLVYHIYNTAFIKFEFGYASAISVVLFAIVLTVTILQFRMEKKFVSNL